MGHDQVSQNLAKLLPMVATAEARGKNPAAWLTEVLLRIQHQPMSRIDALLPHK